MNHREFLNAIREHPTDYSAEVKTRFEMALLAQNSRSKVLTDDRKRHFTAGAVVTNPSFTKALVVHDPEMKIWVFPGGHINGNLDTRKVALQWLNKLTGVSDGVVTPVPGVFDLDSHYIKRVEATEDTPAVEAHMHYCIRHLFVADETEAVPVRGKNTWDAGWYTLHDLKKMFDSSGGRYRVLHKLELHRPT